jgi:photosystem II stability/assembly factor-like uncharacterized protein
VDDDQILDLANGADGTRFVATQSGLLRSADGRNWLPCFEDDSVLATAVVVADGVVYAAIPGGIGRSDDGGQTWRFVALPEPSPLIAILAATGETVVGGTMEDGVFISDDGGNAWRASNAGLFDPDVRGVTLLPSLASGQIMFAATSTGLFRSANTGRRWQPFGDLPEHAPLAALRSLASGALIAAVEGAGLWRSADAGAHWTRLAVPELPADIDLLVVSPAGVLILAAEGLVLSSADDGETWSAHASLLAALDETTARTATA